MSMTKHYQSNLRDIFFNLFEMNGVQNYALGKGPYANMDEETVRHILKTFEEADTGLVVVDGKLIEKPVMREMYRIVSIANKLGK